MLAPVWDASVSNNGCVCERFDSLREPVAIDETSFISSAILFPNIHAQGDDGHLSCRCLAESGLHTHTRIAVDSCTDSRFENKNGQLVCASAVTDTSAEL